MNIKRAPWDFPLTKTDRTPGLHVSEIIDDLLTTLSLKPKAPQNDPDARNMYFEMGFLWEVVLSRALAEKAPSRPGELELDGILVSPDGIEWGEGFNMILSEYKATTKSNSHDPALNLRWMMQIKAYCKVLVTLEARLYVLYMMGDYKQRRWPDAVQYNISFTQTEVNENWMAIYQHAKSKGWV